MNLLEKSFAVKYLVLILLPFFSACANMPPLFPKGHAQSVILYKDGNIECTSYYKQSELKVKTFAPIKNFYFTDTYTTDDCLKSNQIIEARKASLNETVISKNP